MEKLTNIRKPVNSLAKKLYKEQVELCSPASIALSLIPLLYGATCNTKAQLQAILGLDSNDDIPLDVFKEHVENWNNKIIQAVSILFVNNIELADEFVKDLGDVISIKNRNFSTTDVVSEINDIVKEATNNLIPKIIDKLDCNDIMFLGNTIYFEGKFCIPFEKGSKQDDFYLKPNQSTKVQMMSKTSAYYYYEKDNIQVLRLEYYRGYYADIILPPDHNTEITEDYLTIPVQSKRTLVAVSMPKFKQECQLDLAKILKKLGVIDIFDDNASLDRIFKSGSIGKISNAIQKISIEFDEGGTVAAVATGFRIVQKCMKKEKIPVIFKADRPFYYCIKERNGTILFFGKYNGPV